jgi:hypothetical protein
MLQTVSPEVRERIMQGAWREAMAQRVASVPAWRPQDGPQTVAYNSTADVIGYGGAAGGGKTDLLLGLSGTRHRRSLIFRRVFPSLRGMIERSREIFNRGGASHLEDSFNESLHVWRLADNRMIEFGAAQYEADLKKWQGQPHDLLAFDEATEFPENFVRFLWAWLRTTAKGQACQLVLTFNPPFDEGGEWVTRFFAPWLDAQHSRPAADGELRWYAMAAGKEIECENGDTFTDETGATVTPKSRTFFHASLKDNPALAATGYGATIDALPEPLRSLLRGNFDAAKSIDPFQVIPADWVRQAQARWTEDGRGEKQTAIAEDVARGGADKTTIAKLYGLWFDHLLKYPGASTPDGPTAAGLLLSARTDDAAVGVDVIGIGASVYDSLWQSGIGVQGINFGEHSDATDHSGRLHFFNIRAAAYWLFREALDPAQDGGSSIALPPDPELLADLCSPKWKLQSGKILLEPKEDIKKRIGRSPDCGDVVVLAWFTQYNAGPVFWDN